MSDPATPPPVEAEIDFVALLESAENRLRCWRAVRHFHPVVLATHQYRADSSAAEIVELAEPQELTLRPHDNYCILGPGDDSEDPTVIMINRDGLLALVELDERIWLQALTYDARDECVDLYAALLDGDIREDPAAPPGLRHLMYVWADASIETLSAPQWRNLGNLLRVLRTGHLEICTQEPGTYAQLVSALVASSTLITGAAIFLPHEARAEEGAIRLALQERPDVGLEWASFFDFGCSLPLLSLDQWDACTAAPYELWFLSLGLVSWPTDKYILG